MKNAIPQIGLLILLCLSFETYSQHSTELSPGYYVVVGAYSPSRENVAQNYTDVLNRRGFKAGYGFNSSRKYFFVYLKYFTDLKESLRDMEATRKESEFAKAWVRVIPGNIAAARAKELAANKKNENANKTADTGKTEKTPVLAEERSQADVKPQPELTASQPDGIEISDNPPIKQYEKMTLGNTEVFLSLYNATNNRIVEGTVKVIDTEQSKLIKEVKGNEYILLPNPSSKTGQLTLLCEAFGYRKIQHEINFPLPLADTVKEFVELMGTTIVVNFDLVRYHRGDIATLYNVYFYNDAALMLPESKYELFNLLQMMQENPKYRIRLHGHTNGNYHGRIISLGENKNFFSLDGSKQSLGTAKDLSYNRAEVIKDYLAANGIDPGRIDIKAWGGKRPLYDKHGVNAKRNVRVEVEIIND